MLTEWESFTWDQKERLIEYVKIQEGGGDEKEEEDDLPEKAFFKIDEYVRELEGGGKI